MWLDMRLLIRVVYFFFYTSNWIFSDLIRKQPRSIIERWMKLINRWWHTNIFTRNFKEKRRYSVNHLFENLFTFLGGGEGVGVKRSKCLGNFFRFFFIKFELRAQQKTTQSWKELRFNWCSSSQSHSDT